MFRLCFKLRRYRRLPLPRSFSSQSSKNPIDPPNALRNPQTTPPQILPQNAAVSSPSSSSSSTFSTVALSATLLSATIASIAYLSTENEHSASNPILAAMQDLISKSNDSFKRLYDHALQTGVAASVLWQSLASVLSSANHEVRAGFELRVAALLADIAAANDARREAIVGAGGGKVVDWLLESVGGSRDGGTQAEAARALAYLIADPNVCKDVFGRPHAVPHLLRFIFSCQPKKKNSRRTSFDVSDSLKGRSMLVAAIMDVVTSNCDSLERTNFKPVLPGNAETRDIAAAIEVVEEGGLHMDGVPDNDEDDDGGKGLKGIGIKILEGKTVLGLTRSSGFMELENSGASGVESLDNVPKTVALLRKRDSLLEKSNLSSAVIPGLWDDLHCQHVAVPFAAWALANWAMASEVNRLHIQELDHDGQVVMTALMAPERSVKWHGSLVARLLLADNNLPLTNSVSDWSSSLLTTISQASKNDDVSLAQVAVSAFLLSLERSTDARKVVMEKGLEAMRDAAKRTANYKQIQESMAKVIELLSTGDLHLSLEDSQKWSGILLSWVFGKDSSDIMRSSATMALSSILEDHGPSSVTISQGWLAILLKEVLDSNKTASVKAGTQPKTDKVKTQIDQANVIFATQTVNQLAGAVVSLAANQPGKGDSIVSLADLLSLEPFAGPFKNKKDNSPKLSVADSALSALKGLKALTELCSENPVCQAKITQHGVLCLLRRFLLCDDYEKQAALEAYDASRALEAQERRSNSGDASPDLSSNDPSSVRVPPTAHVRRHAARLLAVLSVLPEVQKIILADETWIKWLDDCANGKIVGCSDLKIQSYARAVLLHVLCNHYAERDAANGNVSGGGVTNKNMCPRYDDMIFLINPELPHWKCYERINNGTAQKDKSSSANVDCAEGNDLTAASVTSESENGSKPGTQVDIVFIHGLRGGPYKTWRIAENKTSTKSGLVEKIDEEAGKMGTFWPAEWLSADFPEARLFTLKYKLASDLDVRLPCGLIAPICIYPFAFGCQTNLTQWSGATLPLQEVSSKLLDKLVDAGIGDRPVVFVTHSMGGLVVKQMLHRARTENIDNLVKNTAGIVFYSCPHFGSRLADMPWRMGLVLRPAPTIGELRSGSPRLEELNDFIRQLHKKGLGVLSFCETKVTPIVEGYGGWAFRMEIVPIESAYPGFGELVVLESTDHINSCKPISRNDPSYTGILEFLRKLKSQFS